MPPRRGRPDQGKTATIKDRSVYIYAPTEEMAARWKEEAKRFGMPLSRYLVELIDDAMRRNPEGVSPRADLEKDLAKASTELASLRKENESLRALLAESEKSTASYRDSLFTVAEHSPDQDMLRRLIGLFESRRVWKVEQVPAALGLYVSDAEGMSKLDRALGHLKKIGVLEGDFEEVRCRIGAKKKAIVPAKVREARIARRHKRLPGGLRPADDDDGDSRIVPVDTP
jgi:hypothetical protein